MHVPGRVAGERRQAYIQYLQRQRSYPEKRKTRSVEGWCVRKVTEMTAHSAVLLIPMSVWQGRAVSPWDNTRQGPEEFTVITLFIQGRLIQSTRNRQLFSYTWTQYWYNVFCSLKGEKSAQNILTHTHTVLTCFLPLYQGILGFLLLLKS